MKKESRDDICICSACEKVGVYFVKITIKKDKYTKPYRANNYAICMKCFLKKMGVMP